MSLSAGPAGIPARTAKKRAVLLWIGDCATPSTCSGPVFRVPAARGGFAGQAELPLGIVVVGPRFLVA